MRGPRGETDGNEDKEGELGGASASGSAEAPPSLVGHRCVIDRLFGDGKKKKKLARSFSLHQWHRGATTLLKRNCKWRPTGEGQRART